MCFFRGTLCSLNYSGKILSLQGSGLFLPTTTSVFQTSSFLICQAFIFCCSLAILRGRKLFSSLKDFHFLEMDTSIHYLKSMTLPFQLFAFVFNKLPMMKSLIKPCLICSLSSSIIIKVSVTLQQSMHLKPAFFCRD